MENENIVWIKNNSFGFILRFLIFLFVSISILAIIIYIITPNLEGGLTNNKTDGFIFATSVTFIVYSIPSIIYYQFQKYKFPVKVGFSTDTIHIIYPHNKARNIIMTDIKSIEFYYNFLSNYIYTKNGTIIDLKMTQKNILREIKNRYENWYEKNRTK